MDPTLMILLSAYGIAAALLAFAVSFLPVRRILKAWVIVTLVFALPFWGSIFVIWSGYLYAFAVVIVALLFAVAGTGGIGLGLAAKTVFARVRST